ncbi:cell envelope integrity EipB family protein [Azospirillum oleiclasticum]|uniref:cell envelope integrity EipB family protein n=1 Tax=Azospirillum oleiclasticum TaxID=2735135 RepID=UPI001FE7D94E|nr:cell envelope integrity EipB family protein [Azospirillum oleiclasticum]
MPNRRSPIRLACVATAAAVLVSLAPLSSPGAAERRPAAQPQSAVAADIAPHRAIYRMSLLSARNSSKVTDVRGRMMFEWADACDGWTTEQRFQLRFVYAEGDEMNMTTNYTTWEAKNGQRYRFNVRKLVNGEVDEDLRGEAVLKPGGGAGEARFSKPEESQMELPPGTMFPTAHTLAILEHARDQKPFFSRTIFDGADADGATDVSAVIGKAAPARKDTNDPLLRNQTGWPVRMAFFPLASDAATPEYEMSIRLLRNGVVESMQIDYGDFAVDAVLEKLEPLPKSGC